MSKLCVFVTLEDTVGHVIDDLLVEPHLNQAGWELQSWVWTQPQDWDKADLIVLRSCYDYWAKPEQFEAFLKAREGSPLLNPASLVRWNSNKRYLLQLGELGIPTIPSLILDDSTTKSDRQRFLDAHDQEFVAKPLIGAGGFDMERLQRDQVLDFQPSSAFLLQPYYDSILKGEWSTMFFNGEPSHVVCKEARPGEYRVQDTHGGTTRTASWQEHPGIRAASQRVARSLSDLKLPTPCYARYDFLPHQNELLLMEVELIEPTLFLAQDPEAAKRFCQALLDREKLESHSRLAGGNPT